MNNEARGPGTMVITLFETPVRMQKPMIFSFLVTHLFITKTQIQKHALR